MLLAVTRNIQSQQTGTHSFLLADGPVSLRGQLQDCLAAGAWPSPVRPG